jgi:hypothetical protein
LVDVVRAAPGSFIRQIWPSIQEISEHFAYEKRPGIQTYRLVPRFDFDDDHGKAEKVRNLQGLIAAAMEMWLEKAPDEFLDFAQEARESDLVNIHSLLARGFIYLAGTKPAVALEYLLEDPRRFTLGSYMDWRAGSCELIEALAPHLSVSQITQLAHNIVRWQHFPVDLDGGPGTRFERLRWNHEGRLELLAAIPNECRPAPVARLITRQERSLGVEATPAHRRRRTYLVPATTSGMSAEEMSNSTDEGIAAFLNHAAAPRAAGDPADHMRDGTREAALAFAGFAKSSPERAQALVEGLSPYRHEQIVGWALRPMAEANLLAPSSLIGLVHRLDAKGFQSHEFRQGAAECLAIASEGNAGLDDATCSLLSSWLSDADGPTIGHSSRDNDGRDRGSILWNGSGVRLLPGGNYFILRALMYGYLLRKPMQADAWLAVLERHLDRREQPEVWRALVPDLRYLVNADRERAGRFVECLLDSVDGLAFSDDGVRALAWTHWWLPSHVSHGLLRRWKEGNWERGPQAAGEFALLRRLVVPDGEGTAELYQEGLSRTAETSSAFRAFSLGMAYTAARLWGEEEYRAVVTPLWTGLAAVADDTTAAALMDVFRTKEPLPANAQTRQLLETILECPQLLAGDEMFLVDRFKELLRDGMDPQLICSVATAVATYGGRELGDMSTRRGGSADDLVEIAIALQRIPETREGGTVLFELLMEFDAYPVADVLRSLDRRMLH